MLSEQSERAIRRVLDYHVRGMFTESETAGKLGVTLRDCDLGQVLDIMPAEYHSLIRAGHAAALVHVADTDCLHPEWSPFGRIADEYYAAVADQLLEVNSRTVPRSRLMALCLPSFEREWGVRLVRPQKGLREPTAPTLIAIRADEQIYASGAKPVPATRSVWTISDGLATRLEQLWDKMLNTTRMPSGYPMGLDGVMYHFEAAGWKAGKAWSPRPDTRVGRFVEVAHTLAMFTSSAPEKRPEIERQLAGHLDWFRV